MCGSKVVERHLLNEVELPQPTRTHSPYPHGDFVNLVEDELGRVNLHFGEQAYALNHEGAQMFGAAELKGLDPIGKGIQTIIGFRGSHDKTLTRGLLQGKDVMVCDNLEFSGDFVIQLKHTPRNMADRLRHLVRELVYGIKDRNDAERVRVERYQQGLIKDSVANHAIIQMLRQGVINTQRVEKVVNEYYEPSHVEHLNDMGQRTVWTLHNAATEALKGVGIATLPKRTIALTELMDKVSDYALAA
jgi:hypothetical protein